MGEMNSTDLRGNEFTFLHLILFDFGEDDVTGIAC